MTEVAVSPPMAKPRRRGISRKKLFRRTLPWLVIAALFLISDAARHVTGEMLLVDAGLHLGSAPLAAR